MLKKCLQGEIEVETMKDNNHSNNEHTTNATTNTQTEKHVTTSTFNFLTLEIPQNPLFKDSEGGLIIPQIPIFEILKKFNGINYTDCMTARQGYMRKRYIIKLLPQYLIFQINR